MKIKKNMFNGITKVNTIGFKRQYSNYDNKIFGGYLKNKINEVIDREAKYVDHRDELTWGSFADKATPIEAMPLREKLYYTGSYLFGKVMYTGAILSPVFVFMSPSITFVIPTVASIMICGGIGRYRHVVYPLTLCWTVAGLVVGGFCYGMHVLDELDAFNIFNNMRDNVKEFVFNKIKCK